MASISLPTAALIAGGATAVGGIASASIAGSAAKSAAKTEANAATQAAAVQQAAADKAAAESQVQFQATQGNLQPYIDAGGQALNTEKFLLGLPGPGGGAPDAAAIQATLSQTPGYQFTKQQGLESVQNSYAAQGLGSSGAALKGAATFATGLADQTYEQRLQDYLTLAGKGQQAATDLGQLGLESVGQAGGFQTTGAAATAGGIVGAGAATAGGTLGAASAAGTGINALTNGLSTAALLPSVLGAYTAGGSGGNNSLSQFISGIGGANSDAALAGTALRPIPTPTYSPSTGINNALSPYPS